MEAVARYPYEQQQYTQYAPRPEPVYAPLAHGQPASVQYQPIYTAAGDGRQMYYESAPPLSGGPPARYAVYDAGIDIPFAVRCYQTRGCSRRAGVCSRFRNRIAPSRHSGLNSLSPKEPNNSLTRMSTCSGTSRVRMSPNMRCTRSDPHSVRCRSCKLNAYVRLARRNIA